MTDWPALFCEAASDVPTGRGPNAPGPDERLIGKIAAISAEAESAEFVKALGDFFAATDPVGAPEASAKIGRIAADAFTHFMTVNRFFAPHGPQLTALSERAWGTVNQHARIAEQVDYRGAAFNPTTRSHLYIRLILRSLGSPISANELEPRLGLISADPCLLLDALEADGNFRAFAQLLFFYCYEGWLHPADAVLRFERWLSFIGRISANDLSYRASLAVVGQEQSIGRVREKLKLLLLDSVCTLARSAKERSLLESGVFDGTAFAEALETLVTMHFGADAFARARADRAKEVSALAKTHESSTVRYLIDASLVAQDYLNKWRCEAADLTDDLHSLVCKSLISERRANPLSTQGATLAELRTFMNR